MSGPDYFGLTRLFSHSPVKRKRTSEETTTSTSTVSSSSSFHTKTGGQKKLPSPPKALVEREGEGGGRGESLEQSSSPFAKDSQSPM